MTSMVQDLAKLEAKLRHVFEHGVPFNSVLGLKVESLDPAAPKLRFDMRPDLIGNARRQILHGGVISAVLDVAAASRSTSLYSGSAASTRRTAIFRASAPSTCMSISCAPAAAPISSRPAAWCGSATALRSRTRSW